MNIENNKKKTNLFVIIALLLTVTVILIGTTYAYFTATAINDSRQSAINTGIMELEFTDGDMVSLNNMLPGMSVTKTFKVKNTGTVATRYDVYLSEVINTFATKSDLVYSLTTDDENYNKTNIEVPAEPSKIVNQRNIEPNQTQEYTLVVTFKETNVNQDDNKGKKFSAKIAVNEFKNAEIEKEVDPKLSQGLVAIKFEDKNNDGTKDIVIANTDEEWYNYDNHEWANAAILDSSKTYTVGQVVDEADILQMYVWIPRYRYQLWNTENGSSDEQMINVEFETKTTPKSNGTANGEWLTHPAFTFGNTELEGFWVGKFETSYFQNNESYQPASLQCTTSDCPNSQYLRIKPSVLTLHSDGLVCMYYGARNMENMNVFGLDSSKVDTHMMKNMEWGAVAYLSASKYGLYTSDGSTCHNSANISGTGCQIWINQSYEYKSGCSGTTMDSNPMPSKLWNDPTYGGNSSTTGNMYGIYDMNGGSWEFVMGNVISASEYQYNPGDTNVYGNIEMPDEKYFDAYTNPEGTYQGDAHKNGKLGDATKETLKTFGSTSGGWYSDSTNFPYGQINTYGNSPWFLRGGMFSTSSSSGIFSFGYGTYTSAMTFRAVITLEDN